MRYDEATVVALYDAAHPDDGGAMERIAAILSALPEPELPEPSEAEISEWLLGTNGHSDALIRETIKRLISWQRTRLSPRDPLVEAIKKWGAQTGPGPNKGFEEDLAAYLRAEGLVKE